MVARYCVEYCYQNHLYEYYLPAHAHEVGIWGTSGVLTTTPWEFMTINGSHHCDFDHQNDANH